jgi:DNA-binding MarR family transcriptional regulator
MDNRTKAAFVLFNENWNVAETSDALGMTENVVYRLFQAWATYSETGVADPAIFSPEDIAQLRQLEEETTEQALREAEEMGLVARVPQLEGEPERFIITPKGREEVRQMRASSASRVQ